MIVGQAKNDNIIQNNGVYYGERLGLPWVSRPSKVAPFVWPVLVNGRTVYIDPKNVGLIPWEHEWKSVSQELFNTAKANKTIDRIKSDFKRKFMVVKETVLEDIGLSNGNNNIVMYPSDPIKPSGSTEVIPRTDPKGSPNQQADLRKKKWIIWVVVAIVIGGIIYYFSKKK